MYWTTAAHWAQAQTTLTHSMYTHTRFAAPESFRICWKRDLHVLLWMTEAGVCERASGNRYFNINGDWNIHLLYNLRWSVVRTAHTSVHTHVSVRLMAAVGLPHHRHCCTISRFEMQCKDKCVLVCVRSLHQFTKSRALRVTNGDGCMLVTKKEKERKNICNTAAGATERPSNESQ